MDALTDDELTELLINCSYNIGVAKGVYKDLYISIVCKIRMEINHRNLMTSV